jgi:hypothetical protein
VQGAAARQSSLWRWSGELIQSLDRGLALRMVWQSLENEPVPSASLIEAAHSLAQVGDAPVQVDLGSLAQGRDAIGFLVERPHLLACRLKAARTLVEPISKVGLAGRAEGTSQTVQHFMTRRVELPGALKRLCSLVHIAAVPSTELDLSFINNLIEQYNRYYVVEKECSLGSARIGAQHFQPRQAIGREMLLAEFPTLPVPE